jgi:hypothetical protein
LRSYDHESCEVNDSWDIVIVFGLLIYSDTINSAIHHINPTFCRSHLEKIEHGTQHIVKVSISIPPMASSIQTVLLGYDVVHAEVSYTMVECTFEEAYTHDGENQNEERAYKKHIGHGGK